MAERLCMILSWTYDICRGSQLSKLSHRLFRIRQWTSRYSDQNRSITNFARRAVRRFLAISSSSELIKFAGSRRLAGMPFSVQEAIQIGCTSILQFA
jgi:hypothetical protein